ncbi:MAG: outer membrane beta-barrel protein [Flavobacteriales bacterium]|nr:outer membrane beta-barrel protein [Flavobacteriales bacterium]
MFKIFFFRKLPFFFLSIPILWVRIHAQSFRIEGQISGGADGSPLPQASVVVYSLPDSALVKGVSADLNGRFKVEGLKEGRYGVKCSYVGYVTAWHQVSLSSRMPSFLLDVRLKAEPKMLQGVNIEDRQVVAVQKGDTLEVNAAAFKVNPDATAEDLVTKMPGITTENGRIKAQGEEVKRVLLDGKEFFGDDATMALRNLPADIIDRVQIFDRPSDQAQFTGFNDGNTEKTLNIKTKRGMSDGQFGKFYAGGGTSWRYNAGLSFNHFQKARRLTWLAMSNNINQQNFSMQDLLGVAGLSSQQGPGRMMSIFGGMRPAGTSAPGFGGGGPLMNSPAANFLTSNQAGINTTHALGLNYQDEWGKKTKVSGFYFFNWTGNETEKNVKRQYFSRDSLTAPNYSEQSRTQSRNMNHRAGLRLEHTIDSSQSIIWNPTLSVQFNRQDYTSQARFFKDDTLDLSASDITRYSAAVGVNATQDLLYRIRLKKRGRTLSFNSVSSFNLRPSDGWLKAGNRVFNPDSIFVNNQNNDGRTVGYNLTGNVTYTEPLRTFGQVLISYSAAYSSAWNRRSTWAEELPTGTYRLDSLLSNQLRYGQLLHRPGIGFNFSKKLLNFSLGLDYQWASLDVHNTLPRVETPRQFFQNFLPKGSLQLRLKTRGQLRVFYNTSTQIPSVSQLQRMVDNSNPLALTTGNPQLRQSLTHNAGFRLNVSDSSRTRNFFMFFNFNEVRNYVANAQIITSSDTTLAAYGVRLPAGAQFTSPVNMQGYRTLRSFMGFSMPIPFIKCNLNLMAGGLWTRTPGFVNGLANVNNTVNTNTGVVVSSNLGERWDFRVSYAANYNIVTNKLRPASNNNYYTGVAAGNFTLMPWKGLVLNAEMFYNHYLGLQQGFNNNFFLLNAGVGYKFLKNRAAELRLSGFDLLRQNVSISRQVTESYLEDSFSNLLQRYFMVTFTYTLKKFGKSSPAAGGEGAPMGPPPPGFPPPGRP